MDSMNGHDAYAMRYEGLAKSVLTSAGGSPDNQRYADADMYKQGFVEKPNEEGRQALSAIFVKMILDHPNHPKTDDIKELDEKVWTADTLDEINKLIDQGIVIARDLGY